MTQWLLENSTNQFLFSGAHSKALKRLTYCIRTDEVTTSYWQHLKSQWEEWTIKSHGIDLCWNCTVDTCSLSSACSSWSSPNIRSDVRLSYLVLRVLPEADKQWTTLFSSWREQKKRLRGLWVYFERNTHLPLCWPSSTSPPTHKHTHGCPSVFVRTFTVIHTLT